MMRFAYFVHALLLSLLWLGLTAGEARAQVVEWFKAEQIDGRVEAAKVKLDNNSNLYVTGSFIGTFTIGTSTFTSTGETDVFVAKFDPQGNPIWARHIAGPGEEPGGSIAVDNSGNVYVSSTFEDEVDVGGVILENAGISTAQESFIAKYDTNGSLLWVKHLSSERSHATTTDLAVDEEDNLYSATMFSFDMKFGTEELTSDISSDAALVKSDPDGNLIWSRIISGRNMQAPTAIHVGGGSLYVAGYFYEKALFESITLTATRATDIFMARYDTDGAVQWAKQAGGMGEDAAEDITADSDRNVYVTGSFRDEATFGSTTVTSRGWIDGFLAKLDSAGTELWVKNFGGSGHDFGNEVVVDSADNIYVRASVPPGDAYFGSHLNSDMHSRPIFARYNGDGLPVWVTAATSSDSAYGWGMDVGSDGRLYVAGGFRDDVTLGSFHLTTTGWNVPLFLGAINPAPLDDLIFADGFEAGDFSAWTNYSSDSGDLSVRPEAALVGEQGLHLVLDDKKPIGMRDEVPSDESKYRFRFYLDPNSIPMADGEHHVIFFGYQGSDLTRPVLRVEFGYLAPNYRLRVAMLTDGTKWFVGGWKQISDEPHMVEVQWVASTGPQNGLVTMWIDDVVRAHKTGIDNDTRRIDTIRLGAVAGIDANTRGTYFMDAFESRHETHIGADPAASVAMAAPAAATDMEAIDVWEEVDESDPEEAALMAEVLEFAKQQQGPQLYLPWLDQ